MADTPALGAGTRKGVEVQVLSWAPLFHERGFAPLVSSPESGVAPARETRASPFFSSRRKLKFECFYHICTYPIR